MEHYRVMFDSLEWQTPVPGARIKIFRHGEKQIRLVEFTSEFVEPHWCEKGHLGFVVEGELEIDFQGSLVRYPQGSGINIPQGAQHGHKARAVSSRVLLFLVEEEAWSGPYG